MDEASCIRLIRSGGASITISVEVDLFGDQIVTMIARRTNWTISKTVRTVQDPREAMPAVRAWILRGRQLFERYAAVLEDGLSIRVETPPGHPLIAACRGLLEFCLMRSDLERVYVTNSDRSVFRATLLSAETVHQPPVASAYASGNVVSLFPRKASQLDNTLLRSVFPEEEQAFASLALHLELAGLSTVEDVRKTSYDRSAPRFSGLNEKQRQLFETWLIEFRRGSPYPAC